MENSPRSAGRSWLGAVAGAALALLGCQTESVTSDGRVMPPSPRSAPPVPEGAVPTRMSLLVAPKADDTDGNGYPDQIQVVVALFAYPHPTAMEADGAFVFTLFKAGEGGRADATPIATWRMAGDDVAAARTTAIYGRCYRFLLSLTTSTGRDDYPLTGADLRGRFEPTGDHPVVRASEEIRRVQIGRR